MLLPVRGIDGSVRDRVAAMYHHTVTDINSYMAILLNIAIVNCMDGLTALICLDGALSIQRMYLPDITKELLCSYLSLDVSDKLNVEAGKLKLDGGSPLSSEELQKLLNGAER